MILLYLIIAAWIDYKTKQVYRIGSILFIGISVCIFGINMTLSGDIAAVIEKISSIALFSAFVILQGKCSLMGWGDVLTYIGVFFWLGSWKAECMMLELLAVYLLLTNGLFLVCNIRKIEWKKGRMKEETAFLPAMAGAAVMMWVARF